MLIQRKRQRASKTGDAEGEAPSKRRPGRPLKRISDLKPKRNVVNEQDRKTYETRRCKLRDDKAHLSALESLPVEIIQSIFFLSLEINLARASYALSQVLSEPSVYDALVLLAYFESDYDVPVETKLFLPAEYRDIWPKERRRLQKGISSCKWFTLEQLKRSMPKLSRLAMLQEWHKERETELRIGTIVDIKTVTHPKFQGTNMIAPLPDRDDHVAMEKHFRATPKHAPEREFPRWYDPEPTGFLEFLPAITTWYMYAEKQHIVRAPTRPRRLLCVRLVPDSLLNGSWTDEKERLLYVLRYGGASTILGDTHQDDKRKLIKLPAQLLFDSMANAIEQRRENTLRMLLELYCCVLREPHPEIKPPGSGFWFTSYTEHPIPLKLFHLATKQGDASSNLMLLLLRADLDSVPRDDDVLTKWGLCMEAKGEEVGKWLLGHMADTNEYRVPWAGVAFVNGGLKNGYGTGFQLFGNSTFTEELWGLYKDTHF